MSVRSALTCLFLGEPEIGEELLQRLGDRGVRVINVASGTVALDLVYQFDPAVIVLGGGMRDLSTCEVYRHIKLNLQRNVPVILLYEPMLPVDQPTIASPGDEMLAKPITPEVLSRKIFETLTAAVSRNDRIWIGMGVDCLHDETVVEGFARNISEGGIFVETNHLPRAGSHVTMSLHPSETTDPLQREGRVIHHRELDSDFRFGMGVEFTEVKEENRQIISAFLSDKLLPSWARQS